MGAGVSFTLEAMPVLFFPHFSFHVLHYLYTAFMSLHPSVVFVCLSFTCLSWSISLLSQGPAIIRPSSLFLCSATSYRWDEVEKHSFRVYGLDPSETTHTHTHTHTHTVLKHDWDNTMVETHYLLGSKAVGPFCLCQCYYSVFGVMCYKSNALQ